jgi:DNA replication protein DnaC
VKRAEKQKLSYQELCTFAELEFIPKAENIVFIGPTGVGKTGLASALLPANVRVRSESSSAGGR